MYLLIPAAGQGKRMGSERNKLLLPLLERPILAWTVEAALAASTIEWIGIIGQSYDFADFEAIIASLKPRLPTVFIQGGDTRQESVYRGLRALPPQASQVLIHDGARCLATPELFDRCSMTLPSCQALIAAIPVKDTIKIVDSQGWIQDTPPRENLWAAQTPQGFGVELLQKCHEKGRSLGWEVTDDAALLEKCRIPVKIEAGEETNLKVTTPADLALAALILRQRLGLNE